MKIKSTRGRSLGVVLSSGLFAVLLGLPLHAADHELYTQWNNNHVSHPENARFIDFSYAGYAFGDPANTDCVPAVSATVYNPTSATIAGTTQIPLSAFGNDASKRPTPNTAGGALNDDGVGINLAIEYVRTQTNGGILFLPAGRYDIGLDPSDRSTLLTLRGHANGMPVVLRGAGPDETIIHMVGEQSLYLTEDKGPQSYLHDSKPMLTVGSGSSETGSSLWLRQNAEKGDDLVYLADSAGTPSVAGLQVGDTIEITMRNTVDVDTTSANVSVLMTAPCVPMGSWTDFGSSANNRFRIKTRVAAVYPGACSVRLATPLPRKVYYTLAGSSNVVTRVRELKSTDHPSGDKMWSNIGIEDIRFTSKWGGDFYHHATTQDNYFWNGIVLIGVCDSWIKNVKMVNLNNFISMTSCHAITVKTVSLFNNTINHRRAYYTGCGFPAPGDDAYEAESDSHFGFQVNASSYCLLSDLKIYAHPIHMVSIANGTAGCVFSRVDNRSEFPAAAGTQQFGFIDSHGGQFPNSNLFELHTNFSVGCAGNTTNMPHCGQDNVFWNIAVGPDPAGAYAYGATIPDPEPSSVFVKDFFTWSFFGYDDASATNPWNAYQLFPRGIVVRAYKGSERPVADGDIRVGGVSTDNGRDNMSVTNPPALYVSLLNSTTAAEPASLYDAQRSHR